MWREVYRERVGRRGMMLLVIGTLQGLLGWSIILAPPATFGALPAFSLFSQQTYAWMWIVPGIIAILGAFSKFGRLEAAAFFFAYLMPFLWGLAYVVSWWPDHALDVGTTVRAAGLYWCYAAIVLITSGWPDRLEPTA